jgi:hypothetical protein
MSVKPIFRKVCWSTLVTRMRPCQVIQMKQMIQIHHACLKYRNSTSGNLTDGQKPGFNEFIFQQICVCCFLLYYNPIHFLLSRRLK